MEKMFKTIFFVTIIVTNTHAVGNHSLGLDVESKTLPGAGLVESPTFHITSPRPRAHSDGSFPLSESKEPYPTSNRIEHEEKPSVLTHGFVPHPPTLSYEMLQTHLKYFETDNERKNIVIFQLIEEKRSLVATNKALLMELRELTICAKESIPDVETKESCFPITHRFPTLTTLSYEMLQAYLALYKADNDYKNKQILMLAEEIRGLKTENAKFLKELCALKELRRIITATAKIATRVAESVLEE